MNNLRPFVSALLAASAVLLMFFMLFSKADAIPAFPGAEGGGANAVGGRGGRVIFVENVNDSGPGSLRACVVQSGPRTCIFRTGGTIQLRSEIQVNNPFLTIAGQTAPGGGIQLSGKNITPGVLRTLTNEVIVRYIRLRKGFNIRCAGECGSGLAVRSPGSRNIVIDHITQQWNQDEGIDAWGVNNITFSYILNAEPVGSATEDHPTGWLAGHNTPASSATVVNIDFHHNLTLNNNHRNPLLRGKSSRIVNNIWYNHSGYVTHISGGMNVDNIGNKYVFGPINGNRAPSFHEVGAGIVGSAGKAALGNPSIHMLGNIGWNQTNPNGDQFVMTNQIGGENGPDIGPMPIAWRRSTPLPTLANPITVEAVSAIEASILPIVGASRNLDCTGKWFMNRDAQELKLINQYRTNTGAVRLVRRGEESGYGGGGYPNLAGGTACPDNDNDGMPNAYEVLKGFNPNVANNNTIGAGGFTQLELYLAGEAGGGPQAPPPATPPDPAVNKFTIGARVFVSASSVNVRATASAPAGTLLGTQPQNAQGVVIDGPTQTTSGAIWYNINFDTGVDGWVGQDLISLVVDSDTPPSVAITAPMNGAAVSGATVEIKGTATDNTAVTGYQLKLDGANLGTEDTSGSTSYSFIWNTTAVSNGAHVLTAVARDGAGNQTTSSPVNVTVNNPTGEGIVLGEANILSTNSLVAANIVNARAFTLAERATVQSMTIFVQATTGNIEMGVYDDDGPTGKPGTLLANTAPALPGGTGWRTLTIVTPVVLNPGVYWLAYQTDGGVTLKSEATGGVNSRDTHTFGSLPNPHAESSTNASRYSIFANLTPDVDVTAPTVALTAPAAGNVSGAAVSVTATASDAGGVAGVSFHAVPPGEAPTDGNRLGIEDTTSTYGVTWDTTTFANGPYSMFAVARDVAGNKAFNVAVAVTVSNGLAAPSGLGVVREAP